MSDHQEENGCRGLVTITTDGMEALKTNGTNQIVPPDSPKRGHLFVLNTTVDPHGEMNIQRTLVDAGQKQGKDFDEASDITEVDAYAQNNLTIAASKETTSVFQENQQSEESNQREDAENLNKEQTQVENLEEIKTLETQTQEAQPVVIKESGELDGVFKEYKDDIVAEINKVNEESHSNTQGVESCDSQIPDGNQSAQLEHEAVIEVLENNNNEDIKNVLQEDNVQKHDIQLAVTNGEHVDKSVGMTKSDSQEISKSEVKEASQVQEVTQSEIMEEKEAEVENESKPEKPETSDIEQNNTTKSVEPETKSEGVKVKRTLTLPWQKKHVAEDSPKETRALKSQGKSDSVGSNPLSGVMKNLKKSLKIKVGSANKSGEDPAPGRIPQKSGPRPSPRIVSSLNITPTHQPEIEAKPVSAATCLSAIIFALFLFILASCCNGSRTCGWSTQTG